MNQCAINSVVYTMEGVDKSKLLDTFTELLAYIGDMNALDGYSIKHRQRPLSPEGIRIVVKAILDYLEHDITLTYIPDDIAARILKLKELTIDIKYSNQFAELIEYIRDYQ